jgi:hypothetical protein
MTLRLTAFTILALSVVHPARADQAAAPSDLHSVAPALERYNEGLVESDLWKRPDLSPRDRSAVTISALIATGQTAALKPELNRALDNGGEAGGAGRDHDSSCLLCRLAERSLSGRRRKNPFSPNAASMPAS